MAFEGSFQHAFDEKCRVSIPSSFREDLRKDGGDAIVVVRAFVSETPCLDVFTAGAWERILKKFETEPAADPKEAASRRVTVSTAHRLQLDKQGRIVVPLELRQWARLTTNIRIVSCVGGFQLWDPLHWEIVDAADVALLAPNLARDTQVGA